LILIIDNYDSFTYNLYQQIARLGHSVVVAEHDAITIDQIKTMSPTHIVISPGPKRPENSGISCGVIQQLHKRIPILGVCLGHQCIGQVFGSNVIEAPTIMHGKPDAVQHTQSGLFTNLPSPFMAARYNSLVLDKLPKNFQLSAWSDDGTIMALEHEQYPLYGVQFHPESFMTEHGDMLMRSFLQCTAS
jgi:anthranilate synthase/aminodeoxychorismate synthase-like glutamine amidotransferase